MEKLPIIEVSGTPYEIGLAHGKQLASRIKKSIEFYRKVFGRADKEIFDKAKHFKTIISEFNSNYTQEIEGIAEGASVEPLWIYALNSRSEILTRFISECTAFYTKSTHLLAQNWDWAKELESLIVIMRITNPSGHKILQITEPGIIGKIGINSYGIGVTLNFLHMDDELLGLPIHITLRHFLDSETIDEGIKNLGAYKSGKSGNIIVGTTDRYVNLEFANKNVYISSDKEQFIHTNHFLNDDTLNTDTEKLASSFARYERANQIVDSFSHDVEGLKRMLADGENSELPICRPYIPSEDIGNSGTVTSIIMDLKNLQIHATKGNPFENEYSIFSI